MWYRIPLRKPRLVKDAEKGGFGFHQDELHKIGGLETAQMPLRLPQDCEVRRVRLPGRGMHSRWNYTLSGKERLKARRNRSRVGGKMNG